MNLFESASALQRFKTRNNLHISSPNHASAYILTCKIKKAIRCEFEEADIRRIVTRLEKLPVFSLRFLWSEYEKNGTSTLIDLLGLPIAQLRRLANERNEQIL